MIFVTGGAGFIGANFVREWLGAKQEPVLVIDKLTYAGNLENVADLLADPRFVFAHLDICDRPAISALFEQHAPRAVVHFAAETHVDRSILGPGEFIRTNINGTFELLEAARAHWDGLGSVARETFRFLHVSTDEVYGSLGKSDPPCSEVRPYSPNSPYSASKAAADHLVRAYHQTYGLPTLVTSSGNTYGPYQFPEKLIPLMILNALDGKPLPVYGDGSNIRDWLYVTDHCHAIARVLDSGRYGESYNVGANNEIRNLDVVQTICGILDELRPRATGRYAEQVVFVDDRPGHDRRCAIDATKISTELGWVPTETFATGLRKTVRWYLDHPQWVAHVRDESYRDWLDRQYAKAHVRANRARMP
jgi:dTDP-glucose 4,6-dehydratase